MPDAHLPNQRWYLHPSNPQQAEAIAHQTQLPLLLAQVLINRGLSTPQAAQVFLNPESQVLTSPLEEFPDLAVSVELLETAIRQGDKMAICGDYDADGMTSTALLLRAFKTLGAQIDYAIPSRMQEGYGINERIVEDFAAEGVRIVLTVDNGIAAYGPIQRARELGLVVIVTDHHDLPPQLPPANAILNPKLLPEGSAYSGLAGVGVAYILAVALAQQLGQTQALVTPLLELFTLGTIADMAALVGVNRRWLQRGLKRLPHSQFAGVQALVEVSGSSSSSSSSSSNSSSGAKQAFKPETIGFRLGPRINAIGRIGDPQTVIELLTTDDPAIAHSLALECEHINQQRKQLCRDIEAEAIALIDSNPDGNLDPLQQRVLVVIETGWHHGVIGIVASRLVERYGVPVFIGTYEDETHTRIRGSARSIPEFDIFEALHCCGDLLDRFGGHRAAGGFSLEAENLESLRSRLSEFAHQHLLPEHLKPLVTIDAQAQLSDLDWDLYHHIDQLQPCGIGNPEPVFWSQNVRVLTERIVGQTHLKLTLAQSDPQSDPHSAQPEHPWTAIAWRWAEYSPLPEWVDIAYRLRDNTWNGNTTLELELVGIRASRPPSAEPEDDGESKAKKNVRSPLLPNTELKVDCPVPPPLENLTIQWEPLVKLESLVPKLSQTVLIYGYQRPYISTQDFEGEVFYDRPRGLCQTLLLWTLPPSGTHLRWLLAMAQPHTVYVRHGCPKLPDAVTLRSQLSFQIVKNPEAPLNLLDLGQQWWVAPSTLVAALRDMKYSCPKFPATADLEQELERLARWYQCPIQRLATIH